MLYWSSQQFSGGRFVPAWRSPHLLLLQGVRHINKRANLTRLVSLAFFSMVCPDIMKCENKIGKSIDNAMWSHSCQCKRKRHQENVICGFFILKHVYIVDAMNELAPNNYIKPWSEEKRSKWKICIRWGWNCETWTSCQPPPESRLFLFKWIAIYEFSPSYYQFGRKCLMSVGCSKEWKELFW
jgi:hypothetical protein